MYHLVLWKKHGKSTLTVTILPEYLKRLYAKAKSIHTFAYTLSSLRAWSAFARQHNALLPNPTSPPFLRNRPAIGIQQTLQKCDANLRTVIKVNFGNKFSR